MPVYKEVVAHAGISIIYKYAYMHTHAHAHTPI